MTSSRRRRLIIAFAFLLPNLLGFVVFTAGPVLFSLVMSFTDWALTKHNRYSDTPIQWVGLQNFERVLTGDESHLFWDYFGNTAFLMLGIPVGIAGSFMGFHIGVILGLLPSILLYLTAILGALLTIWLWRES